MNPAVELTAFEWIRGAVVVIAIAVVAGLLPEVFRRAFRFVRAVVALAIGRTDSAGGDA